MRKILFFLSFLHLSVFAQTNQCEELKQLKSSLGFKDKPFDTIDQLEGFKIKFLKCEYKSDNIVNIEFSFENSNKKNADCSAWVKAVDFEGNIYDDNFYFDLNGDNKSLFNQNEQKKSSVTINGVKPEIKYFKVVVVTLLFNTKNYHLQYKDVYINDLNKSNVKRNSSSENKPNNESKNIDIKFNSINISFDESMKLGAEAYNSQDHINALKYFENAVTLKVDTVALIYAGIVAQNLGEQTKAMTYLERYLEKGGKDPSIFYTVGEYYNNKGNFEASEAVFLNGIELTNKMDLRNALINLYITNKYYEKAVVSVKKQLSSNPTADLYFTLGSIYDLMIDRPNSILSYNNALKLDKNHFGSNYNLGVLFYNQYTANILNKDNLVKAKAYFEKSYQINSTDCELINNLNTTYEFLKENKRVNCVEVNGKIIKTETNKQFFDIRGEITGSQLTNFTKVYAFDPLNKEKIYGMINIIDNTFVIRINELKDYIVFVEEPDKLGNSLKFTKEEINGKVVKNKILELISYKSGNKISFRNINFQSGKAVLLPESYQELDKVANFLLDQKNVKIEIIGHTDDVGGENDNLLLSKERAESVSFYLISKGIPKNAFKVLGMGKSSPLIRSIDENSRYLNRRVELKIL